MYQNLNPPPFKDPVDQGSRGDLMPTWHAWFSQLFKWLQSLGNSVSNLVSNYNTAVVWDGVNDRVLGIGQHTSDSFTSATSMPLHIACGDGQMYEMRIVGSYTAAPLATSSYLQPNNTIPSTNSFTYRQDNGSGSTPTSNTATYAYNGFFITGGSASILESVVDIFTSTLTKRTIAVGGATNTSTSYVGTIVAEWQDTTTVWSSLGTITMPNAWTGQIVCRRVA